MSFNWNAPSNDNRKRIAGYEPSSYIEKADIAIGDLQTNGGYLAPAQAREFISLMIKESVLLQRIFVKTMRGPTEELNQVKFGSRILHAGTSGSALSAGNRSAPDTSDVTLTAQLFKAEVHLNDEVVEDNIEQGRFVETVVREAVRRVALDVEEILVNGDTASGDPDLAVLDGLIKQATSNIVNFTGRSFLKDDMSEMWKDMPSRYKRMKREMVYLTGHDAEQDYRNSLSDRATGIGDRYLIEDQTATYSGIPVMAVPVWPEDLGTNNDQTVALLTAWKNIVYGIWRKIKIERDREISEGLWKIVITIRWDVKYQEEDAVVKGINIATT